MGIRKLFLPARETIFFASRVIVPFTVRTLKKKGDAHELDEKVPIEAFQDGRIVHARKAPQDEGKKEGYETDIGLAEKTEDDRQKEAVQGK